jgi:hypothetical protein
MLNKLGYTNEQIDDMTFGELQELEEIVREDWEEVEQQEDED